MKLNLLDKKFQKADEIFNCIYKKGEDITDLEIYTDAENTFGNQLRYI